MRVDQLPEVKALLEFLRPGGTLPDLDLAGFKTAMGRPPEPDEIETPRMGYSFAELHRDLARVVEQLRAEPPRFDALRTVAADPTMALSQHAVYKAAAELSRAWAVADGCRHLKNKWIFEPSPQQEERHREQEERDRKVVEGARRLMESYGDQIPTFELHSADREAAGVENLVLGARKAGIEVDELSGFHGVPEVPEAPIEVSWLLKGLDLLVRSCLEGRAVVAPDRVCRSCHAYLVQVGRRKKKYCDSRCKDRFHNARRQ